MDKWAYIITRNRYENLIKIIPRWLDQDFQVMLVVDPSEYQDHIDFKYEFRNWTGHVAVTAPKKADGGVGYQRKWAMIQAALRGSRSIIMSDDDMRPANGSDMALLLKEALGHRVLGVGATRSLHDRNSKGATSRNDGVILCPGGWGMQLFSLNVDRTHELGNFDPKLDCFGEDAELMRQGISERVPWLVHCGVKCEAIGARYAPGGINDLIPDPVQRGLRERYCRGLIHERWPDYTSDPDARPRMAWQRMLDDYIPGWRSMSAIHGGVWHG